MRATVRVAGIYGGNASGKSNVLSAMSFALGAIRSSATLWSDRSGFPHHPFKLDSESSFAPSEYEFDFIFEGARLQYGFRSNSSGVLAEWLTSYESSRPRKLFVRGTASAEHFEFGRSLPGQNRLLAAATRNNVLFLSSAANNKHPYLTKVARHLSTSIRYARFSEQDQTRRLNWTRTILENPQMLAQAQSLLRFADVGISGIVLHEDARDSDEQVMVVEVLRAIQKTMDATSKSSKKDKKAERPATIDLSERQLESLRKSIRFSHGIESAESFAQADESSGTLAWLSLAVPSLHALAKGGTLLIDELDASLHPRLSSAIVSMFKDTELNPRGAQLIFTSHDTTLLGQFSHSPLDRDEVWFCEKLEDGSTQLFSLSEFPTRKSDNFERKYLQGRYGAVPMISSADLRDAINIGELFDSGQPDLVATDLHEPSPTDVW